MIKLEPFTFVEPSFLSKEQQGLVKVFWSLPSIIRNSKFYDKQRLDITCETTFSHYSDTFTIILEPKMWKKVKSKKLKISTIEKSVFHDYSLIIAKFHSWQFDNLPNFVTSFNWFFHFFFVKLSVKVANSGHRYRYR